MRDSTAYACVNKHFPRIASAISLYWGQRDLVTYIDGLLMDTRPGTRRGFPLEVVTSLTDLLEKHHADFPEFAPSGNGIWVANNKIY